MMMTMTKMMITSEEKGKRNNRVVVSICIRIYSLQRAAFRSRAKKREKKDHHHRRVVVVVESRFRDFR